MGEVTLDGTSHDVGAGADSIDLNFVGVSSGSICAGVPVEPDGTWNCDWNTALVAPGIYDVELTVRDLAGNASPTITRTVVVEPMPETVVVDTTAGVAVSEAGAGTSIAVNLSSQPVGDVTVAVTPDSQLLVDSPFLTFTVANWNVPQVVGISAIDDAVDETDPHAGVVGVATSSVDPAFDGLVVPDVTFDIADDDAPDPGTASATLGAFTELVNPQYQHASGSTMWFNPARAGSFRVAVDAIATPAVGSGTFPALGAGWTPASDVLDLVAPYEGTYAWTAGVADPGAKLVTVASTGGATGTDSFTVSADATPPAGATIAAQSASTRDTSAPVSGNAGTDTQSGIGSWRFQRRTAPLAAGTCGVWGAWTSFGTINAAGAVSDAALADATCITYRLVVTDNVGNVAIAEQVGELGVDRSAPVATIDVPIVPLYGTVTLTGTASDAVTGVRTVSVLLEDRYTICPSATVAADGRWTCEWVIDSRELGAATIKVTMTDMVGQRTFASRAVTMVAAPSPFGPREEQVDRTPPVVGLARMPLVSWTEGVKVKASAYDDRPGTIEVWVEQQSASSNAPGFSRWTESFEESEITPLEDHGETTCFRGVAVDEVGNKAVSDPRCTTLPLDDVDLTTTGEWEDVASNGAWLGTLRRTTQPGAAIVARVADANPVIVVTTCRGCGAIKVMHGRRVVKVYSLAAKMTQSRRLIQLPNLRRPLSAPLRIVAVDRRPVMVDALITAR